MNGSERIIKGQYKLLGPVGRGEGGMGIVYRAIDLTLDREVAVKMIRPEMLGNVEVEKRFLREAKALGRLNHPNIANIYNFFQDGNEYCLVMELIKGRDLADLLKEKGPFSQTEAIRLIMQALDGLAHAHDRGVLHRDLKPANLMVTSDGTVKILDFGIAKFIDSPASQTMLTTGLTGTVRYMAPELLDNGQPSACTDLYALNLVLYELLTGRAAFRAPTVMRLITQILNEPPPPLRQILPQTPVALAALIERMMAKQPSGRISDARQFAKALTETASTRLVSQPSQPSPNLVAVASPVVDPQPKIRVSVPHEPVAPVAQPARQRRKFGSGLVWLLLSGAVLLGISLWFFRANTTSSGPVREGKELVESGKPEPTKTISPNLGVSSGAGTADETLGSDMTNVIERPVANSQKPTLGRQNAPAPINKNTAQKPPVVPAGDPNQSKPLNTGADRPVVSPISPASSVAVATNNVPAPVLKPTEPVAEPTEAKSDSPKKNVAVTKQTTLRLVPINAYRADQLSRGDVVQFVVNAQTGTGTVPLGQQITAHATVSEVQAIGDLNTRSYIFLKRMVLETAGNESIKLNLASSEPEIRFDSKQTNAVIGPLLMRPAKAFSVDL